MNKIGNGIRDPVHKWIKFNELEKKLIDHPFMQRLRWVNQLASVNMVFPGGVHTRFAHSLGAMHLAGKYMSSIINNTKTFLQGTQETQKTQERDVSRGPQERDVS